MFCFSTRSTETYITHFENVCQEKFFGSATNIPLRGFNRHLDTSGSREFSKRCENLSPVWTLSLALEICGAHIKNSGICFSVKAPLQTPPRFFLTPPHLSIHRNHYLCHLEFLGPVLGLCIR